MPDVVEVARGVLLTGDRAAYLPASDALVIADVHVGYARAARRRGGWLPPGEDAAAAAARVLSAAARVAAAHVVIAGDLRHSTRDVDDAELVEVRTFLDALARTVRVTVVPGNHDRDSGRYAAATVAIAPTLSLGDVAIVHEPPPEAPATWTLCGHLHPVTTMRDATGAGARYPCALVGPRTVILPAFGDWPGGTSSSRLRATLFDAEWRRYPMSGGEVFGPL